MKYRWIGKINQFTTNDEIIALIGVAPVHIWEGNIDTGEIPIYGTELEFKDELSTGNLFILDRYFTRQIREGAEKPRDFASEIDELKSQITTINAKLVIK